MFLRLEGCFRRRGCCFGILHLGLVYLCLDLESSYVVVCDAKLKKVPWISDCSGKV